MRFLLVFVERYRKTWSGRGYALILDWVSQITFRNKMMKIYKRVTWQEFMSYYFWSYSKFYFLSKKIDNYLIRSSILATSAWCSSRSTGRLKICILDNSISKPIIRRANTLLLIFHGRLILLNQASPFLSRRFLGHNPEVFVFLFFGFQACF